DVADVAGHDGVTVDSAAPATFGLDGALLASPRLDNLVSVHSGLMALLADDGATGTTGEPAVRVLAAFAHEACGSVACPGADGSFLEDVVDMLTGFDAATRQRALADSWLVSSDVGHAVHPNHAERHDPTHQPVAGGGPILKVNANQRYTSDAH